MKETVSGIYGVGALQKKNFPMFSTDFGFVLDGSSYEEGTYNVLTAKYKLTIQNNIDGIPAPYFDTKHYYLPIGLGRTANNSNLVENPGYQ